MCRLPQIRDLLLALLTAVLMANSGEARAGHYKSCEFYLAGASNVSRPVAELMKTRGDAAARACFTYEDKLDLYRPVSRVQERAQHVCSFEVFPVVYPVKANQPILTYMAVSSRAGCPLQNDAAYVEATNVSGGVYAALIGFADQLCLNPKNGFDPFVSSGAHDAASLTRQLAEMCAGLPASQPLLRGWLFGLGLDTAYSPGSDGGGHLAYRMSFGDFGKDGTRWNVWTDLEQGEIRVTKIEHITNEME